MRRLGDVELIGELMLGLPINREFKALALHYKGICLKYRRDFDEAQRLLEQSFEEAAPEYKGRVLQSIGAAYHHRGAVDEAIPFFVEAAKAAREYDPLTVVQSQWVIAIGRSVHGDHRRALSDLEELFPRVCGSANIIRLYTTTSSTALP